jgi:hypothetical protein
MYLLVGFNVLLQSGQESRQRAIIVAAELTSVAVFEVGSDIGIHAWPVVALQEVLFSFVNAIVPYQQISVSVGECVGDEQGW